MTTSERFKFYFLASVIVFENCNNHLQVQGPLDQLRSLYQVHINPNNGNKFDTIIVSYNTRVFLRLSIILAFPPLPKESRLSFFDSSVERVCNWRLSTYDIECKPSRIISTQ